MIEKHDIEKLRQLPIETVAERLGLAPRRHKSLCPFHEDSHPSLTFSQTRNTYRCYACGAHGNTIDLVMNQLHMSFGEACRWLAGEYSVAHHIACCQRQPVQDKNAVFDARKYERCFDRPWLSEAARRFLFDERRLNPGVVSWCRLSSWRDREGTQWLQIPYFDTAGRLVGVQSRNLDGGRSGKPRFRFPKGSHCGIYNLPVLQRLTQGEPLFITEGASDCWAMLSSGHKAIAIPSATLLGREDRRILHQYVASHGPLNLHIYPDADIPGEQLYLQLVGLANELRSSILRHRLPPGCKDYAQYWAERQTTV